MCGVDADTFKQIFRDHWDAFKMRYPTFDTPDYNTAVQKSRRGGENPHTGMDRFKGIGVF